MTSDDHDVSGPSFPFQLAPDGLIMVCWCTRTHSPSLTLQAVGQGCIQGAFRVQLGCIWVHSGRPAPAVVAMGGYSQHHPLLTPYPPLSHPPPPSISPRLSSGGRRRILSRGTR